MDYSVFLLCFEIKPLIFTLFFHDETIRKRPHFVGTIIGNLVIHYKNGNSK